MHTQNLKIKLNVHIPEKAFVLKRLKLFVLFVFLLFNSYCAKESQVHSQRQLNVFVWSAYIPEELWKKFEADTGIDVNYDTFDSNEALLQKMQSGVADYDVIIPSDYMVRILSNQNLLESLNHSLIPNLKNIHPRFMNPPYDHGNRYSIPFLWSTTGIAYDTTKVQEVVDSWGILWNPKYRERVLMLDDMRECFSVAMKWKGHSLNSTDPLELDEAKNLLMQQKPLVKAYNSTNFDEILLSGDVWLAHSWSGNMVFAIEQNPHIAYAIPKEGAPYAVENFAVPKGAKHLREAQIFINYCLDPKVGAQITNLSRYPNTNEAAKAYIKPEILKNPVIYPDDETLKRCELMSDMGPAYRLLDRYWTEIKSH